MWSLFSRLHLIFNHIQNYSSIIAEFISDLDSLVMIQAWFILETTVSQTSLKFISCTWLRDNNVSTSSTFHKIKTGLAAFNHLKQTTTIILLINLLINFPGYCLWHKCCPCTFTGTSVCSREVSLHQYFLRGQWPI